MSNYRVVWEIDICAGSPRQAAETALRIQRDAESTATVFEVIPMKSGLFHQGDRVVVDLRSTNGKVKKSKKEKG